MLVIAHRGANREAIENTCKAFDLAIEGGASRIELDLQPLRDGKVAIYHDNKLKKHFGSIQRLSEITSKDAERLTYEDGQKMVMLEQVVEEYLPKVSINFELKGKGLENPKHLLKLLKYSKFTDQAVISSFEIEPLLWLKDQDPSLQVAFLWGQDTLLSRPSFFFSPVRVLKKYQIKIFHPQFDFLGKPLMQELGDLGCQVFPWVPMVSNEDHRAELIWEELDQMGVHGLCTNYPREMAQWKKNRNLQPALPEAQ